MATSYPARASRDTMVLPMPEFAPVTSTVGRVVIPVSLTNNTRERTTLILTLSRLFWKTIHWNALASSNPFACMPASTDHAVQGVGVRAGNEFSRQSREDDDGHEEKWNAGERLSCEEENMEQRKDDEHVGEIDFVASLAKPQKRPENTRTSPVALRCGGDEHAGADREKG